MAKSAVELAGQGDRQDLREGGLRDASLGDA
jgi:hypothetical protein